MTASDPAKVCWWMALFMLIGALAIITALVITEYQETQAMETASEHPHHTHP